MKTILVLAALLAADDDAAKQARAEFKKAFASREASARASAVSALASVQHPTITKQLGALLTADVEEVRLAAARGLGGATEDAKRASAYLAAGYLPNKKMPAVQVAILDALGALRAHAQLGLVHKQFSYYDMNVASAAIAATGEIRNKTSIPALIALLKDLDAARNIGNNNNDQTNRVRGNGGGGGGFTFNGRQLPNAGGENRARQLTPRVNAALEAITGQKHDGYRAWSGWWAKNARTFRVPEKKAKDE